MTELFLLFMTSFITFFVLIDAVGVAPVFASLTAKGDSSHRRQMALRGVLVASIILFAFAFGGSFLLEHMGISLHAFRMAGGVLLFLIAIEMVFEKRTERRNKRGNDTLEEHRKQPDHETPDDVSIFPLAIPMLAGPGSIATAMLFMGESQNFLEKMVILSAIGANMILALLILLLAGPLVRFLGHSFTTALTRILGVILTALAIQLMIDGLKGAFGI